MTPRTFADLDKCNGWLKNLGGTNFSLDFCWRIRLFGFLWNLLFVCIPHTKILLVKVPIA